MRTVHYKIEFMKSWTGKWMARVMVPADVTSSNWRVIAITPDYERKDEAVKEAKKFADRHFEESKPNEFMIYTLRED